MLGPSSRAIDVVGGSRLAQNVRGKLPAELTQPAAGSVLSDISAPEGTLTRGCYGKMDLTPSLLYGQNNVTSWTGGVQAL